MSRLGYLDDALAELYNIVTYQHVSEAVTYDHSPLHCRFGTQSVMIRESLDVLLGSAMFQQSKKKPSSLFVSRCPI